MVNNVSVISAWRLDFEFPNVSSTVPPCFFDNIDEFVHIFLNKGASFSAMSSAMLLSLMLVGLVNQSWKLID